MVSPDNRTTPWTFVLDEPLRILVVDDDPILREFASVYLATPTATIETACDGVAARMRLGQTAYDLVLLDIEMPHLDGFSLLEEIRSNEKLRHLPVIMLTGRDDIASIDRAYQLGANSFATKPVNWRQLSYQIRYVLRPPPAPGRQAGSHDPVRGTGLQPTPATTERDVHGFFQSVIDRANSLEQQLVGNRALFLSHIQNVRSSAQRAFAEYSRAEVADRNGVVPEDRTLADRKSADVVDLQF